MTTLFEKQYLFVQPVYCALHRKVRELLRDELRRWKGKKIELLDVGGRKSHYTIGLNAAITISDLPRESAIQKEWCLGITPQIMAETKRRRSNVKNIAVDDMVQTRFHPHSFDMVVSIEVLEHVMDDVQFVKNVSRVLRSGGLFIMTTPNGACVKNTNPDHHRHYTPETLSHLLSKYFSKVQVWSDVRTSRYHTWGLRSWAIDHPMTTLKSMVGNAINYYEAPHGNTQHLFASCQG